MKVKRVALPKSFFSCTICCSLAFSLRQRVTNGCSPLQNYNNFRERSWPEVSQGRCSMGNTSNVKKTMESVGSPENPSSLDLHPSRGLEEVCGPRTRQPIHGVRENSRASKYSRLSPMRVVEMGSLREAPTPQEEKETRKRLRIESSVTRHKIIHRHHLACVDHAAKGSDSHRCRTQPAHRDPPYARDTVFSRFLRFLYSFGRRCLICAGHSRARRRGMGVVKKSCGWVEKEGGGTPQHCTHHRQARTFHIHRLCHL